jgi:predicted dehydrogenase
MQLFNFMWNALLEKIRAQEIFCLASLEVGTFSIDVEVTAACDNTRDMFQFVRSKYGLRSYCTLTEMLAILEPCL